MAGLLAGLGIWAGCGEQPNGQQQTQGPAGEPSAGADDARIRIVGSSTVYPFSTNVADHFGDTTRYPAPVVESTGSGGGHKLFGSGVGPDTPDITNSSRRIKLSEFQRAQENGVNEITEAVIGYDGIAFAQNVNNDPINLTVEQIHLAVAEQVPNPDGEGLIDNPYQNWREIDASLPDRPIKIYGPPTTSGTRDAFEELVMEEASSQMAAYDGEYSSIRQDGAWIDSGEQDNVIVNKIAQDREAFGVFGYSFLEENRDKIRGASVNGYEPRPATISSGEYPISRSLYFYIKNAHVGQKPGLREFVREFMSERMIGADGLLREVGLIPLPEGLREASRHRVENLVPLTEELVSLQDYARQEGFVE
jgi:phosphate transport system substrate-binding protein